MIAKVLPWVLVVGLMAGAGWLYSNSKQQRLEVEQLRQEREQLSASVQEANKVRSDNEASELVRLRRENEDLLRLRNEVRQLREEKTALSKQVQTAQSQVQAQSARGQSQATTATPAQAPQPGQPEVNPTGAIPQTAAAAEEFRKRYGVQAGAGAALQPGATVDPANLCINILRAIEAAKVQWSTEKAKPPNTLVAAPDISPYLKDRVMPACPAGGSYSINPVGVTPTCSSPGHVLPK